MVAIAQSSQFAIFIRKVGWSVGLEKTFARVRDLVDVYCEHGEISRTHWDRIVEKKWHLKNDLIGKFLQAIEIVQVTSHEVHPLNCLDSLALARVFSPSDNKFSEAFRYIVGSHIVLNDGDIFLNFLSGKFSRDEVEPLLGQMIRYKRHRLLEGFRNPRLAGAIAKAIGIDVQETNTGGTSKGRNLSAQVRKAPLTRRVEPLDAVIDLDSVQVSDDYFRKVTSKRRDWASDMGLFDGERARLQQFLLAFEAYRVPNTDAYSLWPLDYEMDRLGIKAEQFGIHDQSLWGHISMMYAALETPEANSLQSDQEDIIAGAYKIAKRYQLLNPRRAMLRREVPLSVLYHSLAALSFANGAPLPDIQQALVHASSTTPSPLVMRKSKHLGATVLPRG